MRGFVALTSVLILSIVMLGFVIAGSTRAFYVRANGLERFDKTKSELLADACASILVLKLVRNEAYGGEETYEFGESTCNIGPVYKDGVLRISEVSGIYSQSVTALEITFNITDLTHHDVSK